MKREDFNIEGIPKGYRVYDVDLTPSGQPVAVLGHRTDQAQPVFARWHGDDVALSGDALSWHEYRREFILSPIVRACGEDLLIIVNPMANSNSDINAWVWNLKAEIQAAFHAGDDVPEVLASADLILLFYSDVGQTGDIKLSRQAMAVMSHAGELLWGHAREFRRDAFDVWFHAAVWEGRDRVAVFADVRHKCAFVRLDLRERRQQIWRPPLPIATPTAVTTIGERVILSGAGTGAEQRGFLESFSNDAKVQEMKQRLEAGGLGEALSRQLVESFTNDPKAREMLASHVTPTDIVEWWPGETTWRVIGSWPARQLRGLPGGRFIAVQPDGYTILSFD